MISANPGKVQVVPGTVNFGSLALGQTARTNVSLLNQSSNPIEISNLTVTGQTFALGAQPNLPIFMAAGASYGLDVQFIPNSVGAAAGQLLVLGNSGTSPVAVVDLNGTGVAASSTVIAPTLSSLSCNKTSMTGSGTIACILSLTASAPADGLTVGFASSSTSVIVPNTLVVPANTTSIEFTTNVSSVPSAQAVTLTASASGVTKIVTIQLNAAILALSISASNLSFGDVVVNSPATQSLTVSSTGTLPVTVNEASLMGAGFTLSGTAFPVILDPGQMATVYIQFKPLAVGAVSGQLNIVSNSTANSTSLITLSGTGMAAPQAVAITVTPTIASTIAGSSQQFAASLTGTSNSAVIWAASGTGCTGVACGTISSSGLYTAPATVPFPATVTITATSVADPSKSALASVTIVPPAGTIYYLAPAVNGGNDSNNGLSSGTPWLSPNHLVNCGDVIIAAPSTAYASANFQSAKWGQVSCPAGNSVAWLKCAIFDGCKIAASNQFAMSIDQAYWGVQGWEVSGTGNSGVCFGVSPTGTSTIHHIILANNICNGGANGFAVSSKNSTTGVDYVSLIGNISWNAAQSTALCNSGITIFEPIKVDSNMGTHIFIAGNFSFDNESPTNCLSGSGTYDGNGIVLDDIGNLQSGGVAYDQQIVIRDNIGVWNGGYGFGNTGNGTPSAPIFFLNNTSVHNETATNTSATTCGDITLLASRHTTISNNLIQTAGAQACRNSDQTLYGVALNGGDATDTVEANWIYSAAGNNIGVYGNNGFTAGTNTTGMDPLLANPVDPGKPNCSGKASTVDCMSTIIANYTPANSKARTFGYRMPQNSPINDPLFPQWLCTANLPSGLVTIGCSNGP